MSGVGRPAKPLGLWRRALLVCAGALLMGGGVWSLVMPAGVGGPMRVAVEPGQSVWEVAAMLREGGLIRSAPALSAAAYVSGKWRRLQAGRHELAPSMTPFEILHALCQGAGAEWRWVTIPEGYTLRQTAEKIEEEGLATATEFLREAGRVRMFEVGFPLPAETVEGYLYPDTYRIEASARARDIIAQMLRGFEDVVWQELFGGEPTYHGRSLREIVVLASLVEGEAQREDERAVIAGVLTNRLERGQRLECDATVQYALGDRRKPRLMHEDLWVESEYNTYLHLGLPPGPICSPGEASIRAAMEPADVPYLYYVARPDGSHAFSRTFAEHRRAIVRIRRESSGGTGER